MIHYLPRAKPKPPDSKGAKCPGSSEKWEKCSARNGQLCKRSAGN